MSSHLLRDKEFSPPQHTSLQKFGILTKFLLPLVLTQMIPDIAEQTINRGITSLASDDMAKLLASYGLAYYILRFLLASSIELRHIGLVLTKNKDDSKRMLAFSAVVGVAFSIIVLVIGLTPIGTWLIRDVHRQSQEVSDLACNILSYFSLIPIIEAIASFTEGSLIRQRLTVFAGLARITDFSMQVLFTIVFLFTPTRTEPVLIPVFALYAGIIGRFIFDFGFWYVSIWPKLPTPHRTKKRLSVRATILFWLPLTLVRFVQMFSYPVINVIISRNLSISSGEEEAAKAVAIVTAVYPTCRFVFSWLNDLRTVAPTFHRQTKNHEKFSMKVLTLYSVFCTVSALAASALLFANPKSGYFIMNTIIGLDEELAGRSTAPLQIFSIVGFIVGARAHLSGILILKKQTIYLTPSAVVRLTSLILFGIGFSQLGISGAILATTSIVSSFSMELICVSVAFLIAKYKVVSSQSKCCLANQSSEHEKEDCIEMNP